MQNGPELREQLRSLSIPREQRPGATPAGRRSRRFAGVVLLLVIALGLAGYVVWDKWGTRVPILTAVTSPPMPIRLLKVQAQRPADVTPTLTATGKIVSDHHVDVATKVSGQIVALFFEQGDHVKRGQLLARIEDVLPQARRDEAVANLAKARADFEYQKVNFTRVQALAQTGQASDIEFAEARRAYDEAQATVAAGEATLAYAEKVLDDCQVLAPIDGVILERDVEVGDFVAAEGGRGAMANSQLGSIADMTQLRVEVDVNELDVARLWPEMPCVVIPDANKDRHYRGRVLWIDPGANYAKATVQVKVRIDEPDDSLRVEGAAQVQFLSGEPGAAAALSAGLWIPLSAVQVDGDGHAGRVLIAQDGRLRAVPVTLGRRERDSVEVISGLSAGQEIAAEGLERLVDGQHLPQ
jgi:RND family efflux transporter MFP subunit